MVASKLWVLGVSLGLGAAQAADLSACDERLSPFAQPLTERASPALHAQAVWLDAERLHWAGQPASGRYRLLHSAKGGLVVELGQAVKGAERSLALQPAAPLAGASAQSWPHLQAGALLALSQTLPR